MTLLQLLLIEVLIVYSLNGQYSNTLWNLVLAEQDAGRVIGTIKNLFPKSSEFYNGDIEVTFEKDLVTGNNVNIKKDIAVFGGKGVQIKPTKNPIIVDIISPNTADNICGIILGNSNTLNFIKKVQILWKSKSNKPWDLLSDPSNGENFFDLNKASNTYKHVLLFEPVPASNIRLLMYASNSNELKVTLSVMHGCTYPGSIKVTCNEVFLNNPKFSDMRSCIPKSIDCPSECKNTKPCFGYNIYSMDSSICSVAQQSLGIRNSGQFFIYKIQSVASFRDEMNPFLNNGIYCRKSKIAGPGITFNRVYYNFAQN